MMATMLHEPEGGDPPDRQLWMRLLKLVTSVMIDDLLLAEDLRMATTRVWLAERRAQDPKRALAARRDLQRAEEELRRLLYGAFRNNCLSREDFDSIMVLLSRAAERRSRPPRPASLPVAL